MKFPLPFLVAAALLAAGHAAADEPDDNDVDEREEKTAELPAGSLTQKQLYRFLLAEVAGQRGQLGVAAEMYLELGKETRDQRVARRATELALHARRQDLALQAVRLWIEIDPNSVQARQTHIGLLAAKGDYAELRGTVAALLAAEPDRLGPNLLHLNRLFARSKDRKAVRETVDVLTAPYLHLAEAHFARAQAAFDMRDAAGARRAIEGARARRPEWELAALFNAQLLENRQEVLALLRDFIAAYPQAGEARMAYARALVAEKQYAEARRQFGLLLEQSAGDTARHGDALFAVAVLSLQLNDAQEAEKYLKRLVEIGHAEVDKARFYLGQIAEEGRQWDQALEWFAKVGPGEHYLPARLRGANALSRLGRIDEARRLLAQTDAGTPGERAQLLIGESQLLREAGRVSDAHAVLVGGLEAQPDNTDLIYEAALMAEKLGRQEELETRLRRLIAIKPDHAHAYNALGYSLADRNIRLDEARKLIDKALELAPNDPFILDSKGWLLFRLGDAQAALEFLGQAYGIRADPEIAAHLGEVLWSLGRKSEALATLQKAQRENPGNEVLAETIKRLKP